MAKRLNGEGSYWFDEAKQLHRAAITTPAGARLTKSSKDAEIVKDWLNEQRLAIGRGQHVEPSVLTLTDWLYQFVETYSRPPKVKQRTYERYRSLIPHVDPIGQNNLQKITPAHLQGLYNTLYEEGFSGSTRRQVHQLLHAALKRAVINRLLNHNTADLVDPPKADSKEVETFTAKEIDLLLKVARTWRQYPAFLLAVTSGMRLGEILGVRWCDIDMDAHVVHVRQNLQVSALKGIMLDSPKTEKGKRKIKLPAITINTLAEYRKVWAESRLKHPGDDDLIFVTKNHKPASPQNFLNRFWWRIQIDAEFMMNRTKVNPMSEHKKLEVLLEEHRAKDDWQQFPAKNFHAIRHTWATTLLAAGVPIVDVSRALGHAKVSTTLNIYGHAIPENSNMIAEKIAVAFLK